MKKLQNKIKRLRIGLGDIRFDLFFQSLPDKEKKLFYESLKLLNTFEDSLIINHVINKK